MSTGDLWDRVISLIYPPRCLLCGKVTEYDRLCCGHCVFSPEPMGPEKVDALSVASPMAYIGPVRGVIWTVKRERDRRAAAFFSGYMERTVRESWPDGFDGIIPVPSNPQKMKERGFNQAQFLAEALGRRLEVELLNDVLARSDETDVQHRLSVHERRRNAEESYHIRENARKKAEGKRLLLVDDVYTTGATLRACGGLLQREGALSLCAVTAAYTPLYGKPGEGKSQRASAFFAGCGNGRARIKQEDYIRERIGKALDEAVRRGTSRIIVALGPGPGIICAEVVLQRLAQGHPLELECCVAAQNETDRWQPAARTEYLARYEALMAANQVLMFYSPPQELRWDSDKARNDYMLQAGDDLLLWGDETREEKRVISAGWRLGKSCVVIGDDRQA